MRLKYLVLRRTSGSAYSFLLPELQSLGTLALVPQVWISENNLFRTIEGKLLDSELKSA